MAKKTEAQTARQQNQLSEISEYTTDIRYLQGKSNVVADALSRPNGPEGIKASLTVSNIDYNQEIHPFVSHIAELAHSGDLGVYVEVPDEDEEEAADEQLDQQTEVNGIFEQMDECFNRLSKNDWMQQLDGICKRPLPTGPSTPSLPAPTAPSINSSPQPLPPASSSLPLTPINSTNASASKAKRSVHFASPLASKPSSGAVLSGEALRQVLLSEPNPELTKFDNRMKTIVSQDPDLQRFFPAEDLPVPGPLPSTEADSLPLPSKPSSTAPTAPATIAADKPLPDSKLHELQDMVNSIDHYSIDLEEMARQQSLDPEFRALLRNAQTGLSFRKIKLGSVFLHVDVSNGPARPFVPLSYRRRIFNVVHGLGHPGIERTRQSIADKFVWPNLKHDVSRWSRECLPCQRAKIQKHIVPPISEFAVPPKRFQHIHMDLVSMPPSNGHNHLLTIVDRFSRWPVAIPIPDINAETVIDQFTHGWIANYGVPEIVTTDRGSQFTSQVFNQLLRNWGIKHISTTAYHPQSNGMVERLHRRLKESLIALGNGERHQWFWKLPMTLLTIRTTIKPDIGASPSDLVYGEGITVPGQLIGPPQLSDEELLREQRATQANLRVEVERLQPKPTAHHRRPRVQIPEELATATHVLVRKGVQPSLTAPYEGPYRVLARNATGYRVEFPGRNSDEIALARLKPAFVSVDDDQVDGSVDDPTPPSPPPPGRPPGIRTRVPQPSSRVTRSAARQQSDNADEPNRLVQDSQLPGPSRDVPGLPLDDSPPPPPRRPRRATPRFVDDDPIDPTGGVDIPADPNLAQAPDAFGQSIIADAFPHLPDPLCRDPNDINQPLVTPAAPTDNQGGVVSNQGGVRKRVLSFSKPTKGNFSYRRRRPDVNALREILSNLNQPG